MENLPEPHASSQSWPDDCDRMFCFIYTAAAQHARQQITFRIHVQHQITLKTAVEPLEFI